MTILSRGSLIVADMIALSVTWYKLGARRLNVVTGTRMSFSHVLLRDGKSRRTLFCSSINDHAQDQYTSGTS